MKQKLLLFLALFLCSVTAWAQNRVNVSGTVTMATDNAPIIGASVLVKGTSTGTITDLDGNFRLEATSDATLVISYVGCDTQEVPLNGRTRIEVALKENTQELEQVVVVGYGTQKKADLSSSIAVLDTKEFDNAPGGLSVGLQSSVPGVQVTDGNIRIRGVGSVNSTDPLYVVDGMIGGTVPDESNIASVQVLKDAASCAIYGARGANGVIVITTKRGQAGDVKVNYDGFTGWKWLSHTVDMLTGQQLAELINEEMYNADPTRTDYMEGLSNPEAIGKGYNMLDYLTQTGFYQKHNVSITGGSDNANFRVNLNYNSDKSELIKDEGKTYTMQVVSDFKKGILKFGETMNMQRYKHNWSDYNFLLAQKWSSICPVFDDTNEWGYAGATYGTDCANPLAQANMNWNRGESTTINGNVWATIDFFKGLQYKFNAGVDFYRWSQDGYIQDYSIGYDIHTPDEYNVSSSRTNRYLFEHTLTYDNTFGEHHVTAMVGLTSEQSKGLSMGAGARSMPSADILDLDATQDESSKTITSGKSQSAMYSVLVRLNYSYASKYLFTFNFRRDGSSNFSKNNRYGNFPSVSGAWRISSEKFMQRTKNWLDDMKIRASWGMLGNSDINPYQYQSTVSFANRWYYLNNVKVSGGLPTTPANPDVKWETQYSTDVGIDMTMLNRRLSFTADYYYKKTKDMLLEVPISYTVGYGTISPTLNAGSIENSGVEFLVSWRDQVGKWNYGISANLSTVHNKVLDLGTNNAIYAANSVTKTAVGSSVGMFYGYVTDGLFKTQSELDSYRNSAGEALQPNASVGDIRFKDMNGDGVIDDNDKDYIGNPIPDFTYGITMDASYKSRVGTFDFSMIWQGSQGNDIFNYSRYENEAMYHYYNNSTKTLNRFRAEDLDFVNPVSGKTTHYAKNTDTDIPRAVLGDPNNNRRLSDRYIENGSYLRLKTITLGYTLPHSFVNKYHVDDLRLYVGAKNLFTITSYSGYDPEVGDQDGSNNLTRGVDGMSIYDPTFPNTREFYVGFQLTF